MKKLNLIPIIGLVLCLLMGSISSATYLNPANPTTVTTAAFTSVTGTLNKELLTGNTSGWYDTQNLYTSMFLDIYTTTTVTGGVLTFEQTNDTTNDSAGITLNLQDATVLTQTNVTTLTLAATTVKHYIAAISSRYVRIRISTAFAGTGTVGATVHFKAIPYEPLVQSVNQATAGSMNTTATIASGTVTTVSTVTAANIAAGTTNGCASPGSTLVSISGATSGTSAAQIIALVAAKKIFICSMTIMAVSGTTPTFSLVQGTGTNCATGQTTLITSFSTATAGQVFNFTGPVAVSVSANAVCYLNTGTTPIQNYTITYTQQ